MAADVQVAGTVGPMVSLPLWLRSRGASRLAAAQALVGVARGAGSIGALIIVVQAWGAAAGAQAELEAAALGSGDLAGRMGVQNAVSSVVAALMLATLPFAIDAFSWTSVMVVLAAVAAAGQVTATVRGRATSTV